MAKRLTDSDKWRNPWFRKLSLKASRAWLYLLDSCDHCGIWRIDFELASFLLGYEVTQKDFDEWFGNRLIPVGVDQVLIPSFIRFQYNLPLNANNKVHQKVIDTLYKYNIDLDIIEKSEQGSTKGLPSPCLGAKEEEEEEEEEEERHRTRKLDFIALYLKYPRHDGKKRGLQICAKQITNDAMYQKLSLAIDTYASQMKREGRERQYMKQFSTFMNCWEEWAEKAEAKPAKIAGITEEERLAILERERKQFEKELENDREELF